MNAYALSLLSAFMLPIPENKFFLEFIEITQKNPKCRGLTFFQSISIGHDNSGFGAAWFLDKAIVSNQKTKEMAYFLCGGMIWKVLLDILPLLSCC